MAKLKRLRKLKKSLESQEESLPSSAKSSPDSDPLSTKEPESSFGGEEKTFILLVNDSGEANLVFNNLPGAAVVDAQAAIAEMGADAGLRIFAFQGVRLPVTKKKLELVLEDGRRWSMLPETETLEDEAPEDGCVLVTDEPGAVSGEDEDREDAGTGGLNLGGSEEGDMWGPGAG